MADNQALGYIIVALLSVMTLMMTWFMTTLSSINRKIKDDKKAMYDELDAMFKELTKAINGLNEIITKDTRERSIFEQEIRDKVMYLSEVVKSHAEMIGRLNSDAHAFNKNFEMIKAFHEKQHSEKLPI